MDRNKIDYFEILVNAFTEMSARQFREELFFEAKKDKRKPITVHIDTLGGSMDALATMVEAMESVPNNIITVCVGRAISAGAILLSFGDYRFCGRHSRVMVHECLTFNRKETDVNEAVVMTKESLRVNEYWLGRLAENCKIKNGYQGLKKMLKNREDDRTIYLDAAGALRFGIVDFIGMPQVDSRTDYIISTVPAKVRASK